MNDPGTNTMSLKQDKPERPRRALLAASSLLLALCNPLSALALDFGPDGMFSLTGFAEVSAGRFSNTCESCQRFPTERKQRIWADELVQGAAFNTSGTTFTQIQPYLGFKYDLGRGYKVSGLLSQRWRDGSVDVEGFWYDKSIALSHEDYGSVRIGAMTTRLERGGLSLRHIHWHRAFLAIERCRLWDVGQCSALHIPRH
jgi:hypothetical protein